MNKFPIKINKSEIQKTDSKIEFFNEIIESSITSKSDILYEQAHAFCGKECNKCFEICDEIIKMNPHYIQAYLKKIRCKKRTDRLVQLSECEDLLIKLPKYSMKIKFQKLSIISKIENRKEELRILLNELSQLTDLEIENNYDELALGFGELNMHNQSIECYTKYISANPKKDFAFNNRGVQFEKIGQYENAINDFKKSIELIASSKESDYNESLNRSKRNLLRVEGKLNSQNDDLPF
jgi:tetratricopeptide (TPR) repeat protein